MPDILALEKHTVIIALSHSTCTARTSCNTHSTHPPYLTMKHLLSLLALLSFTLSACADEVKHVESKAAAEIIAKGEVIVLDVRTADEFAEGHIKGAKNIDFLDSKFKAEAAKLDKTKTYLVHCQAGGRSTKSLESLKELGIKNLIHLDDGFGGWKEKGLPVEK